MHPLIQGLLSPWEWRIEVLTSLSLLATLYTVGWLRVRAHSKHHKLATGWRLAAYYGGLASLALALISPIDILGGQLLMMHMVQHKILVMVAAPLLWLGSPFPIGLWALPAKARHAVTGVLAGDSIFRRVLTAVSSPGVCWFVFLVIYLGWHDPNLYNLALSVEWVHDLEHITFFLGALLFWWPVVGAAPRLHKQLPYWVRAVYVLAFVPPNAIAGFVIANATSVIYTYYDTVPHIWGFSALEDQMVGGSIMWIWSSEMMIDVALIMFGVSFYREKRKRIAREQSSAIRQARQVAAVPGRGKEPQMTQVTQAVIDKSMQSV